MAHSGDTDLILDKEGTLISLYKRNPQTNASSGVLLTPQQVAKCVKFFWLEATEVDGIPDIKLTPYAQEVRGLKVNVIGGATGAGKTSLIHIMAGGMETEPKTCSDTKCPSVYLFKLDGEGRDIYALLDTAGLCDTAATASRNVGMQELLINAVAATVKMYNLQIVSFMMCVDVAGRLPGNFADIWPQMQISLGGDLLTKICHFVVTKMNGDSKVNRSKIEKLPGMDFYQELVRSPLRWPVAHAGRENLDGLQKVMHPTSTTRVGVGSDRVDPKAQSIETKQRIANNLQTKIEDLKKKQKDEGLKARNYVDLMSGMENEINNAYEELLSLGNCSGEEKKRWRRLVGTKTCELKDMRAKFAEGRLTEDQLQNDLDEWDKAFQKDMAEIRKMHGLGAFLRNPLRERWAW